MATMKLQPPKSDEAEVPTMWLHLKAPVEFFERIDRWCERQKELHDMTIRPSRPAAIRYIVHNYLLKQEHGRTRSRRRSK
jgi:hypothetical protein